MTRALDVHWDHRLVGRLTFDRHGDLGFVYDPAWLGDAAAPPISQSLPKRAAAFDRHETRPFFAGLLPDESIRTEVSRLLKISERNDFAFLSAMGGEVAGALSLLPTGAIPPAAMRHTTQRALDDSHLMALLDALPKRPFILGEGVRLSLAGAQTKLPVVLVEGGVALPAEGQATTHILKPALRHYPATTENEAFVMQLARAVGLDVAGAEPRRVWDKTYLLVTRYDRWQDENGVVHRLHQEDFCQALGIVPENKYAREGGPVFRDCFALLRAAATRPAGEVLKLLDAALFNLIAGNGDAHGKNFSLLYRSGETTLAPLYDLVCTAAYSELDARLAMKIGGGATIGELTAKTWQKFSTDCEVSFPFVRRRTKELAALVQAKATTVSSAIAAQGFDGDALDRYAELVTKRAELISLTL